MPCHATACLPAMPCYCLPTCQDMLLLAYLPCHATACLPATTYYCLPTCHTMLLPLPTCHTMLLPAYLLHHAIACLPATPCYCLPSCHAILLPAYLPRHATACLPASSAPGASSVPLSCLHVHSAKDPGCPLPPTLSPRCRIQVSELEQQTSATATQLAAVSGLLAQGQLEVTKGLDAALAEVCVCVRNELGIALEVSGVWCVHVCVCVCVCVCMWC